MRSFVAEVNVITVAQVLRENVWTSDIEWPVVRHSRDKKTKECFETVRIWALRVSSRV